MNAIRMIHPKHGATHAYDLGEVRRLQGLGWAVEVEKAPEPVKVEAEHVAEKVEAPKKKHAKK